MSMMQATGRKSTRPSWMPLKTSSRKLRERRCWCHINSNPTWA